MPNGLIIPHRKVRSLWLNGWLIHLLHIAFYKLLGTPESPVLRSLLWYLAIKLWVDQTMWVESEPFVISSHCEGWDFNSYKTISFYDRRCEFLDCFKQPKIIIVKCLLQYLLLYNCSRIVVQVYSASPELELNMEKHHSVFYAPLIWNKCPEICKNAEQVFF